MGDATPMGNDSSNGQSSDDATHCYPVMHAFSESWLAERRFMPEWAKHTFRWLVGRLPDATAAPLTTFRRVTA